MTTLKNSFNVHSCSISKGSAIVCTWWWSQGGNNMFVKYSYTLPLKCSWWVVTIFLSTDVAAAVRLNLQLRSKLREVLTFKTPAWLSVSRKYKIRWSTTCTKLQLSQKVSPVRGHICKYLTSWTIIWLSVSRKYQIRWLTICTQLQLLKKILQSEGG